MPLAIVMKLFGICEAASRSLDWLLKRVGELVKVRAIRLVRTDRSVILFKVRDKVLFKEPSFSLFKAITMEPGVTDLRSFCSIFGFKVLASSE